MNRQTLLAVALGVLCAALMCIIAGVVVYVVSEGNALMFILGLTMIFFGAFMELIPVAILLWLLVTKIMRRHSDDGKV